MIRALKEFRVYILHSHITTYVPSATIKEILTRLDPDGRRDKWIFVLLEYHLEIKPTKIIKGQGLAKFMSNLIMMLWRSICWMLSNIYILFITGRSLP